MSSETPPRIGQSILKWIYGEELFEEIAGDMEELHRRRILQKGTLFANSKYVLDAIMAIRNYDLKHKKRQFTSNRNNSAMFENYIKITFRNISRNKVYSGLNILGLAFGLAACLFIFQYVSYERSYDTFHKNYKDLYRVQYEVYRAANPEPETRSAASVPRVGPFMKEKMPQVMDYARAMPTSGVVQFAKKAFLEERMYFVDPSFFQIFDFKFIEGDPKTALLEPFKAVISESMAERFFGNINPIGKTLEIDGEHIVEISGIVADTPSNSHIKFDFLGSYATVNALSREGDEIPTESSWGWYDFYTYIRLAPQSDYHEFNASFEQVLYERHQEEYDKYGYHQAFPLQPITDIHLHSELLNEINLEEQGDGDAIVFLQIIALFILIIAWINYINLSTARAIDRAKEVGVRKTMGAQRKQLIFQFLSESLVLYVISCILAFSFVLLGRGAFNELTQSNLNLGFLISIKFWIIFSLVSIGSVLLAGLYPAFVLSSFDPAGVLKGKSSSSSNGKTLRKVLVVVQFAASVSLIAGTITVYKQMDYLGKRDLGFDINNTLVVRGPNVFKSDSLLESKALAFKNDVLSMPEVDKFGVGSNVPGWQISWSSGIKLASQGNERFQTIDNIGVHYEYFDTYGIRFAAGRNYSPTFGSDSSAIILNKAGIKYLGFNSPDEAINQKVTYWGKTKTIIGVVDDYNQMSLKKDVAPIAFSLVSENKNYFFSLRLHNDINRQEVLRKIETSYNSYFPGNPVDFFFLEDFYNRQYETEQTFSKVFTVFSGFAIFVACLGLFGLSSFSALKRTKEIGIRKTLGATIGNIVMLLSKEYILLIAIANIISWPLIYWTMSQWLESFSARINLGPMIFIVAGACVFIVAMITVSSKTVATAKANPVKALRHE